MTFHSKHLSKPKWAIPYTVRHLQLLSDFYGLSDINFENRTFQFYRMLTLFCLVAMSSEMVIKIIMKMANLMWNKELTPYQLGGSQTKIFDRDSSLESLDPWLQYHYFCPSILCYLIATIPMLHMLMAHQFFFKSKFYSCNEEETDYLKFMTPGIGTFCGREIMLTT